MNRQPGLFDYREPYEPLEPEYETRLEQMRAAFVAYHRAHPSVWRLFARFTFQVIERGHRHYSADAVVHRIRWHATVETSGEGFKIRNNHVAFYARMFMSTYPEHDGFFRTCLRPSERQPPKQEAAC